MAHVETKRGGGAVLIASLFALALLMMLFVALFRRPGPPAEDGSSTGVKSTVGNEAAGGAGRTPRQP
jgi:hypothetical protein